MGYYTIFLMVLITSISFYYFEKFPILGIGGLLVNAIILAVSCDSGWICG